MVHEIISKILSSDSALRLRSGIARLRNRLDPFYRMNRRREKERLMENLPYEEEQEGYWRPDIMDAEGTLKYIIENKISVARFGDGEFEIIARHWKDMTFQECDEQLRKKLLFVLENPLPNCLSCVINVFGCLDRFKDPDKFFWRRTLLWLRPLANEILQNHPQVLGDPQISRPYMPFKDSSHAMVIFDLWKKLFKNRKLLVVEGRFSRLGIGNNLFDGATRVRRIWCPPKNAFSCYDNIVKAITSLAEPDELILIALGQTATIMAYDLARIGFWAIDIGHLDVEYMWMLMGATDKVAVPGKYVNEVGEGKEMHVEDGEERRNNVVAVVGG